MTKILQPTLSVDNALSALVPLSKPIFFLQIGANDGVTGDPLYKYVIQHHWAGVLIEPVPYVFERLQNNYRDEKQLRFENVAVSTSNEKRLFWYPRFNTLLPEKYDQIGSFSKEHLLKHKYRFPRIEEFLKCEPVPCLTVQQILQKHNVSKVDVLLIDAEGTDDQIICSFPLQKYVPLLVVFEHVHLNYEQRRASKDFLVSCSYDIHVDGKDTIGLSNKHPLCKRRHVCFPS